MSNIITLSDEACEESYQYFDKNIRPLLKNRDGSIKETEAFHNSDIDAFRHAYVSGRYAQEYGQTIANIAGQANELWRYRSGVLGTEAETNMDLWNNAVGRKLALKAKTKAELARLLQEALANGELIISPSDPRCSKKRYQALKIDFGKPVVVVKKSKTKRNEKFLDMKSGVIMTRAEFVSRIKAGHYPAYYVAMRGGKLTPASKPDGDGSNNLG